MQMFFEPLNRTPTPRCPLLRHRAQAIEAGPLTTHGGKSTACTIRPHSCFLCAEPRTKHERHAETWRAAPSVGKPARRHALLRQRPDWLLGSRAP